MKKKLRLVDARQMMKMLQGQSIASSTLSRGFSELLQKEGLLVVEVHGRRAKCHVAPVHYEACRILLAQEFGLRRSLEEWLRLREVSGVTLPRATQVKQLGTSKAVHTATFPGFLVNCYKPIEAKLGIQSFTINPLEGTCTFIYNTTGFRIPPEVVIVGVENSENFFHLRAQRELFARQLPDAPLLFVSRYPQENLTTLRRWLAAIPNRYVHFGDFDLAGISIYLTEFCPWLGDRASLLVPDDIAQRLSEGNETLYDQQLYKYRNLRSEDPLVSRLIHLIHQYRRGYEQEGYIE